MLCLRCKPPNRARRNCRIISILQAGKNRLIRKTLGTSCGLLSNVCRKSFKFVIISSTFYDVFVIVCACHSFFSPPPPSICVTFLCKDLSNNFYVDQSSPSPRAFSSTPAVALKHLRLCVKP